jgi:aminopeptidase N
LLYIPIVGELIHDVQDADPSAIHTVRVAVRRAVATRLENLLVKTAEATFEGDFDASAASAGRRSLRSAAFSLLSTLDTRHEQKIVAAFKSASTMTESLAALGALSSIEGEAFDLALADFETRWASAPLVMDKWFGVQAMAIRSDIRDRLVRLMERPDYDLRNPNRVRALVGAFAANNPVVFHAEDGWGYRFVADLILKVDPLNPALSARLATSFESWRIFNAPRRAHAQAELDRLAAASLSKNAQDIIGRALADPG